MLYRLIYQQVNTQAQFWLGLAISGAAHLAFVGGLYLLQTAPPDGPSLTIELQTGESAAIALAASMASEPAPELDPEAENEDDPPSQVMAESIELLEPKLDEIRSPMPEPSVHRDNPLEIVDHEINEASKTVAEVARENQRREPELAATDSADATNPRHARSTPSPASSASSISLVQDLGVRQPTLPTRKKTPPLVYPPVALRNGIEGRVEVLVSVGRTGKVEQAKLFRSSGHEILDQAALAWVRQWVFEVRPEWFRIRRHLSFRAPVRFDILPP